jgi:hypothetical protein
MTDSGLLLADFKTTAYQKTMRMPLSFQVKYLRRHSSARPSDPDHNSRNMTVWCAVRDNCTRVIVSRSLANTFVDILSLLVLNTSAHNSDILIEFSSLCYANTSFSPVSERSRGGSHVPRLLSFPYPPGFESSHRVQLEFSL